jgi:hypothetical protein
MGLVAEATRRKEVPSYPDFGRCKKSVGRLLNITN